MNLWPPLIICAECKKLGLKSKVDVGVGTETLVYCAPFYDERGRCHQHDTNRYTTRYNCSNGHEWTENTREKCWCGWPENTEPSEDTNESARAQNID